MKLIKLKTIIITFLVMIFMLAIGAAFAEEADTKTFYAAGFVSGQTYRIEFNTGGSKLYLACDENGSISLTADPNNKNTRWTAAADSGQDFTLRSGSGHSLVWEGSEKPKLTAKSGNEVMEAKMVNEILELADGLPDIVVKSVLDEVYYTGKFADPDEEIEYAVKSILDEIYDRENDFPLVGKAPSGDKPAGPPPGTPEPPASMTEWVYSYGEGKGTLSGKLNSVKWYVTAGDGNKPGSSKNAEEAAQIRLLTDGPLGGGNIISGAPTTAAPVMKNDKHAAPVKFTVTVKDLPEGAEYRWYIDGKLRSADKEFLINDPSSEEVGIHKIYCEVSYTDDENQTRFGQRSWTANFIVCNGVQENSLLTFSDVHQTFENVGLAINDFMAGFNGKIPALVVCTGDWVNGFDVPDAEQIKMNHLAMLKAQIGGIDTVFVSGNHEPAEVSIEANKEANLGYDGSGVIFRSDPRRHSTSGFIRDLIVFGINFDETGNDKDGYDYKTSVYPKLEKILSDLSKDYHGEYIMVSSHTGLHKLEAQEQGSMKKAGDSGEEDWPGGNKYNVDHSSDMVALLNDYAEKYGMNIIFLFGHDHSKGEEEFFLKDGVTIKSTLSYNDRSMEEQTLSFAYGHAGYLTNSINGKEHYTWLIWNRDAVSRYFGKVGEEKPAPDIIPARKPMHQPEPLHPEPSGIIEFFRLHELPATGFSADTMTDVKPRPHGFSYRSTGLTLMIPELDVSGEILQVPEENGGYPVEWLGSSVGLLEQSSLPGEGITILTGHNHLDNTAAGPFLFIGTMKEGDRIMITDTAGKRMIYSVYGNYKIPADGFASIASDLRENTLVLITCEDESVTGGYLNRRVIFSQPVN